MQFDNVPILQHMIVLNRLAFEGAAAPHTRVFETDVKIAVDLRARLKDD